MTEKEYVRLKKKIEDDYRSNLEALERIWNLSGVSGSTNSSPAPRAERSGVTQAVRQAVREFTAPFTIHDVSTIVKRLQPDAKPNAIGNALKRLVDARQVVLVKPGSGTTPGQYALPSVEVGRAQDEVEMGS